MTIETKGVSSAEGVLVRLKNYIAKGFFINAPTMKTLIDEYVSKKHGRGNTKAHFDKVNTYDELTTDKMTIKVFFKFLRVIKIQKVTFTITVTNIRGKEVTVSDTINIAPQTAKGENDEQIH